jgi:O-antigen/teichoic acid export membrane protein
MSGPKQQSGSAVTPERRWGRHLKLWQPVLASASAGTLNRGSAIAIRLVTIPLLLRYLGVERYGLWMTIASATAYLTMLDFGTVSALTNRLSRCYARGRTRVAASLVISATIGLCLVATLGVTAAFIVIFSVDWAHAFHLSSAAAVAEVRPTIAAATILAGAQLALAAILRLPYTMQRGSLSEGYQLAGNLGSFLAILGVVRAGGGLPWLASALMSGPVVAGLCVLAHLSRRGHLSASRTSVRRHRRVIVSLGRAGGAFVVMQVVGTLLFALQFPLLATMRGAAAVAPYALLTQIMLGLQIPLTVLQQPLWTRLAALRAYRDITGLRSIIRNYLIAAVAYSAFAGLVLVVLVNPLLVLLAKSIISTPLSLRLAFAALCGLGLIGGGNLGSVLLALDLSRPLALLSVIQLLAFILVAILLVPTFGGLGMVASVCAVYVIALPPTFVMLQRRLDVLGHARGGVAGTPVAA